MRNIHEITIELNSLVSSYEAGEYLSEEKLTRAQRKLSSCHYWLTLHYVEFKKLYNAEIYTRGNDENGKRESVASAEARANNKYPELHLSKKLLEAVKNVSISMSNELNLLQ